MAARADLTTLAAQTTPAALVARMTQEALADQVKQAVPAANPAVPARLAAPGKVAAPGRLAARAAPVVRGERTARSPIIKSSGRFGARSQARRAGLFFGSRITNLAHLYGAARRQFVAAAAFFTIMGMKYPAAQFRRKEGHDDDDSATTGHERT
jgi:hypothetical protein